MARIIACSDIPDFTPEKQVFCLDGLPPEVDLPGWPQRDVERRNETFNRADVLRKRYEKLQRIGITDFSPSLFDVSYE